MKTSFRILLSIYSILLLLGCREEEGMLNSNPITVNNVVRPFEVVKIYAPGLGKGDQVFEGYFLNSIPVTLGRLGKDSLVFITPQLPMGKAKLNVLINGRQRYWVLDVDYHVISTPLYDSTYDSMIQNNEILLSEIKKMESLLGFSEDHQKWISQLKLEYSKLSISEKSIFQGIFNQRRMKFWTEFSGYSPSMLHESGCEDSPITDFNDKSNSLDNLLTEPYPDVTVNFLADYAALPDTKLYRAVKIAIGLAGWFHIGLLEALVAKTLACPNLKHLVFKIQGEQVGSYIEQTTLILESGVPSEFHLFGDFQKPNLKNISFQESHFVSNVEWFKIFKKNSSKIVKMLGNGISIPQLKEELIHTIPETAEIEQTPLPHWNSVKIEIYDQPSVRMIDSIYTAGKFKMQFESLTGSEQDFVLWVYSENYKRQISAKLKVTCPMLPQVVLKEEKILMEIQYGLPPYKITWSNGNLGAGPFEFSPGKHSVQVIDSNSCEQTIEFEMPEFSIVTDIDGNDYRTVKIGNQWWMAENLRTTRKSDGTPIQKVDDLFNWSGGPNIYFGFDLPEIDKKYGKFYPSQAICCGICPTGWRLPQGKDWKDLVDYLNPRHATKMKTTEGWKQGVTGTNISGFGAYSSGYISKMGAHLEEGSLAQFWVFSPNPNVPIIPPNYLIKFNSSEYSSFGGDNSFDLFPVRCIKE